MAKNVSLTTQNRLIVLGLVLSTVLIVSIACFAVNNIQQKLNEGYQNFGQIISKTLAIEGVEITKDVPELNKYDTLRSHSISILKSNDDIGFIQFTDANGKVIYSSKDDYPKQAEKAKISVSSPMIVKNLSESKTVGSVMVGLSGNIINQISHTSRGSLLFVFAVAWVVFAIVILVNTYLITRELRILHHGVRKISGGEFGYKIEGEGVSSEVKELFEAFNDMSARLHQYDTQNIEQLTLEKNKLEAVLMSIVNGVVVCDNYDTVVLVNDQAKKLLEVEESEILNTKIQQYVDTNGELCFKDKIDLFKDTPLDEMESKPLEFNIEVDKKVIKSVISPMFSRNKDYVGYIVILIDITKETEMEQLRSYFISNVSHELRTPVTVLRSYIDTLYNYGNDFDYNTQKEFIGVMNQEIVRLNTMVNDILDFSRYESESLKMKKEKQSIIPIIEECVEGMKVLAEEHQLTFSIMKEPDLPEVVINHDCIARALNNIIANAIKYSPDGKRIKIKAEQAQVEGYIEVTVEDQGPGVAEEYQRRIFDRFFRVENDTHTVKGTGIGLHIVKVAVEKHHQGQVFVHSKLGEGSTFGFRLPVNVNVEEEVPQDTQADADEVLENTEVAEQPKQEEWEISFEKR